MSDLSYMEKLLDGVEVEWTVLGNEDFVEIANSGRKPVKSSLRVPGNIPYYGANNIQDYVDGYTHDGEYVLIAEDGSASLERYSIQYTTGRFWANNHVHVVRGKLGLNTRYLYHYLSTVNFIPFLTGGVRAKLTKGNLVETPIPIPCPDNPKKSLAIQAEIVRILDAFTELTAELIAELTAREQQYAYYQEELLSFEDDVEYEDLKEIAVFSQGIQVDTSKQFTEKSDSFVRFLRIVDFVKDSEPPRYIENPGDKYVKNEGDLVMIRYGARAAGKVFLKYDGAIANNMFQIKLTTPKITIAYLHCYLSQQKIYNFLNSNGGNSTMPAITFSQIGAVKIPIPTLAEQERIVAILDKFDTLTTSLTEGLPREIELRQQQYEYYRELLLSFPKLEGEA